MKNKNNVICIEKLKKVNKPRPDVTDREISLLFYGLVRLIKNSAVEEVKDSYVRECEFATQNYHAALKVLAQKNEEIKKLQDINETLNAKIASLQSPNMI